MSKKKSLYPAFTGAIKKIFSPIEKLKSLFFGLVERLRLLITPFEAEFMGFITALSLSFSTLYCIISAHSIPASGGGVFFGCAVISASAAILFLAVDMAVRKTGRSYSKIALYGGAVGVIVLIGFLARKKISASACVALPLIAHNYGITLTIDDELFLPETATLFLLCIAVLPIVMTVWSVVRAKSPFISAAASVPIFALSLINFEQLPYPWAICLFIFTLGVIALTSRARSHSDEAGFYHAFRIAPVLAVFIIALALFIDPSQYQTPQWLEKLQNRAYELADAALGRNSYNEFNYVDTTVIGTDDSINLEDLTSQQQYGIPVMSVRIDDSRSCYLRAVSYAGYKNNQWELLPEREADQINRLVPSPLTNPENDEDPVSSVIIRTNEVHHYIFTPYYPGAAPEGAVPYGDACLRNTSDLAVYHIMRSYYGTASVEQPAAEGYRELVESIYLEVPDITAESLRRLAAEEGIITWEEYYMEGVPIESTAYVTDIINRAAEYVRTSAYYSLDPTPVPENADFPVWFLTEAECGYCTHFAASGALLLRAIGVPARLTTGYYVHASDEEWRTVTSDNAHAWVEYYLPDHGWRMVEMTGSYMDGEQPDNASQTSSNDEQAAAATTTTATTTANETTAGTAPPVTSPADRPSSTDAKNDTELSASDSGSDGKHSEGERKETSSFGRFVLIITVIVLIAAAVYGGLFLARHLIISRRCRRFESGSTNSRVIAMWSNILRLTAITKEAPPEYIEDIMLKARFSQHVVSERELAEVRAFMEKIIEKLESSPDKIRVFVQKYVMFCY